MTGTRSESPEPPASIPVGAESEPLERMLRASFPVHLASLVGALAIGATHWGGPAQRSLGVWLAAICGLTLFRLVTVALLLRRPRSGREAEAWARAGIALALLQSGLWGVLSLVLRVPGTPEQEVVLHVVLCATALGAALHLLPVPRVLLPYALGVLGPLFVRDLLVAGTFHAMLAGLVGLVGVYAVVIGRTQARALAELVDQRRRNAALVAALRVENDRSEQARRAAERASAARSRFFAAANHDLRQPLHAIGLLTHSLRHARDPAEIAETVDHLGACADAMVDAVDALLEVARADAPLAPPVRVPVRLDALVREACMPSLAVARGKGLALEVRVPEVHVSSDREGLSRIVGNLVSNAVRYTESGTVSVTADVEAEGVSLAVADTGIGIAPEHLDRVFEEFFQVDNPGRDRRRGFGLGLATVARLCGRLGHAVDVRSTPGGGSCFRVRLGPAVDAGSAGCEPSPDVPGTPAPERHRILVVEDDADARAATRRLLVSWGAQVQAVDGLEAALRLLREGFVPQALVVDLRLADGRRGLDAVGRIRQVCGREVPALLVTGDAGDGALKAAADAGLPIAFKPVRPAALRAFLAQALST